MGFPELTDLEKDFRLKERALMEETVRYKAKMDAVSLALVIVGVLIVSVSIVVYNCVV